MNKSHIGMPQLMDAMAKATLPHASRLAGSTVLTAAADAALRMEAALHPAVEVRRQLLGIMTRRSLTTRRRADERAARARLRGSMEPLVGTGGRSTTAFWHESGSGPTILLLNGWTASGLMWPAQFIDQLATDHRVVRVDNRGTGYARTAPAPFRIADLADDAAQVLDVAGAGPATVVGLSMGGMIAQELTLRRPDLVEGLVLVGTRPPAPAQVPPNPHAMAAVLATPQAGVDAPKFIARAWSSYCAEGFAERHPEMVYELMEQIATRVTPRAAVFAQLRAIAAWRDPGRLRSIACPTVVVHGDADPLMPVGNGMRLSRMIPGARYVELHGVGHIVPMEAPRELIDAIRDVIPALVRTPASPTNSPN